MPFDSIKTFRKLDGPKKIIFDFHGENFFLSNMYPAQIFYKKWIYPATENAYFAWRTTSEQFRLDLQMMTPMQAKEFSDTPEYRDSRREEATPEARVLAMAYFVNQKFFSHDELGDKLLATEDAVLIEGNSWGDTLFGFDMVRGFGHNALGRMTMRTRTRLSEKRGAG
jgi:hypothetical protein